MDDVIASDLLLPPKDFPTHTHCAILPKYATGSQVSLSVIWNRVLRKS